jgi:2'-5' RNA ligase
MSKRLFIGFPVSIPDSLGAALKKLRIGADKREIELEWTPPENFHVTLCFLGATPADRLPEVAHLISSVCRGHSPFETTLKGLGGFPDEHHLRVLWVGVRKSRPLSGLQADLAEAMTSLGYKLEDRDYVPHLTIARTRKSRSGKDLISPYVRTTFGDLRIDNVALYESVMHGARPHYEILETFSLAAAEMVMG